MRKTLYNDVDYSVNMVGSERTVRDTSKCVKVIYAVSGICDIQAADRIVQIEKADLLLIEPQNEFIVKTGANSWAAIISIDYSSFCTAQRKAGIAFSMNRERNYEELKSAVRNFLIAYVNGDASKHWLERGQFYHFLQSLSDYCCVDQDSENWNEDNRIANMLQYVHANFHLDLSLTKIAKDLFMSEPSASRLFRKVTGDSFPNYVRKLRLRAVCRELENSDTSITRIAGNNGFSSSSLNKAFREEYGMTPSEYREQFAAEKKVAEVSDKDKLEIYHILKSEQAPIPASTKNQTIISADISHRLPWETQRNTVLTVGPIYMLRSANMQQQTLMLTKELGIQYVRIWNPFDWHLMVCTEEKGVYNYAFLDEILDFCVENHLRLYLDLAQRQQSILMNGKQSLQGVFGRTEFEGKADWENALSSLIRHVVARYSEGVVEKWIFELSLFWNDGPYYQDSSYSSMETWESGYRLIKRLLPHARVAGPGCIVASDRGVTARNIAGMLGNYSHPDIFTSLHFPYRTDPIAPNGSIDRNEYDRISNQDCISEDVAFLRQVLDRCNFQGEYWVSEWNVSIADHNFIQDSCFRASFVVKNVLDAWRNAATMGIFFATDLMHSLSESGKELFGCGGLLTRHGIRKPVFYAFEFLGMLFDKIIYQSEQCIITMKDEANYVETGNLLEKVFPFLGVRFIAVNDNYDSAAQSSSEELGASLKNLINDVYAKDISRKSSTALKAKRQRGEFIGNYAPYGYLKDPANKNHLNPDPEIVDTVREIFSLRAEGIGIGSLARILNERDIPSPGRLRFERGIVTNNNKKGKDLPWNRHVLSDLLKNVAYIGHLAQGRSSSSLCQGIPYHWVDEDEWDMVENTHEPVIDMKLWNRVQEVNARSRKESQDGYGKYSHLTKRENPYGELLRCADCGRVIKQVHAYRKDGGKVYFNYKCPNNIELGNAVCPKKSIRAEDLDAAVLTIMRQQMELFLDSQAVLKECLAAAEKESSRTAEENRAKMFQQTIDKRTKQSTGLYADYKAGILSKEEYLYAKKTYQEEVERLQQELGELNAVRKNARKIVDRKQRWAQLVRKYSKAKKVSVEMVRAMIKSITLYADNSISIEFLYMDEFEKIRETCAKLRSEVA